MYDLIVGGINVFRCFFLALCLRESMLPFHAETPTRGEEISAFHSRNYGISHLE